MTSRAALVGVVVCTAVLLGSAAHASAARAQAAARAPSISAPAAGRPGDVVIVTLTDWPQGVVTVGVCSNGAARGTQDCNLAGDNAIAVRDDRPVQLDLEVSTPPGSCPCVIRATTPAGQPVVTTPFVVVGVPEAPIVQPSSPPAAQQLSVRARVDTPSEGVPQSLVAPLGGSTRKVLLVRVTNNGTSAADLHVVAQVGKHGKQEPIGARDVKGLGPGATRNIQMPFEISAPAWGGYHVTGTVYGGASPVQFRASTDNDPWLLMLMLPLLLIVVAELLRARDRRARRAEEAAAAVAASVIETPTEKKSFAPVTAILHDAESSPEVGFPYAERYWAASYDPSGPADENPATELSASRQRV